MMIKPRIYVDIDGVFARIGGCATLGVGAGRVGLTDGFAQRAIAIGSQFVGADVDRQGPGVRQRDRGHRL